MVSGSSLSQMAKLMKDSIAMTRNMDSAFSPGTTVRCRGDMRAGGLRASRTDMALLSKRQTLQIAYGSHSMFSIERATKSKTSIKKKWTISKRIFKSPLDTS
jgi:hypothetical protein